jgi:hypothetical protein
MAETKTIIIISLIFVCLVSSVLAWSSVPIDVSKNVSVNKTVEIIDIDTGVKTNMTTASKTALTNDLAISYALYTKTPVNTSKVNVLSQSVKGCITFTYVKFDGKLFTEVSAKRGCVVPVVKEVIKEVDIFI